MDPARRRSPSNSRFFIHQEEQRVKSIDNDIKTTTKTFFSFRINSLTASAGMDTSLVRGSTHACQAWKKGVLHYLCRTPQPEKTVVAIDISKKSTKKQPRLRGCRVWFWDVSVREPASFTSIVCVVTSGSATTPIDLTAWSPMERAMANPI